MSVNPIYNCFPFPFSTLRNYCRRGGKEGKLRREMGERGRKREEKGARKRLLTGITVMVKQA